MKTHWVITECRFHENLASALGGAEILVKYDLELNLDLCNDGLGDHVCLF